MVTDERPFSDISYQQFLNEERLMGSKCKKCGSLFAPPRPICIKCHDTGMQWVEMEGDGKLAAFTCIAVGPSFMIAEGYDRKNHYVSGVVELREGSRVDARIEGVDGNKPEVIKIGTPMTVKYLHRGKGEGLKTYLAFEPV
ncbi:Zn-ribbon domain-containing OB-fold protein [Chloroflexota bacterium]